MSKYLDTNGFSHFWAKLKVLFAGKVDKVDGKGLSTNDFTTAEKTKLAGIADNANKYTHPIAGTAGTYGDAGESRTLAHSGKFTIPIITTDANGHVSDAATIEITLPAGYTLPNATTTAKGGVIVGGGLSVSSGKIAVTSAPKLETARKFTLNGDASGTVSFDGSQDVTITVEVADDSHAHTIANVDGLQTALDAKLDATTAGNTYAKKSDITNVYRYKGSVATVDALPTIDNTAGDVYNVEARGINYAWTGEAWDALGELFEISTITNTEIDTICV